MPCRVASERSPQQHQSCNSYLLLLFYALLRLEAVLVGGVRDGVDQPVRRQVLVAAGYFDGAVVFAHLFKRALLLAGSAVACFEAADECFN